MKNHSERFCILDGHGVKNFKMDASTQTRDQVSTNELRACWSVEKRAEVSPLPASYLNRKCRRVAKNMLQRSMWYIILSQ